MLYDKLTKSINVYVTVIFGKRKEKVLAGFPDLESAKEYGEFKVKYYSQEAITRPIILNVVDYLGKDLYYWEVN